MLFRTEVILSTSLPRLRHSDAVVLIGSCFSDVIGHRLMEAKWHCSVNPMGPLYNPASVAEGIERLLTAKPYTQQELQYFPSEGYGTWMHHTLLSRSTPEEALTVMNNHLVQAAHLLHNEHAMLMITFGTAWTYRLCGDGRVIANCHRCSDTMFERDMLSTDDIVSLWNPLLQQLSKELPSLRLLFTVSPIRHLRDGAHANQLSKATLLLAVDRIVTTAHTLGLTADYFPAYEIVLDELRDYRFYADDMVHPSSLAEEYVWERFSDACLEPDAHRFIARWNEVQRALAHHPFRPESDEYHRFVQQTIDKLNALRKDYPYIDIYPEIQQCHTLLNN